MMDVAQFGAPQTPAEIAAYREQVEIAIEKKERDARLQEESIYLMQNFKEFIKHAWRELEPLNVFMSNWHIDAICEHLQAISESKLRRLQIWVPPGSMKSRLASVLWPAWEWTHSPGLKYWTGSYDIHLAMEMASYSRDLMLSDWYQARWGHEFKFRSTAAKWITNDQAGHRLSTSPESSGTGKHGHRILVDDAVNALDASAITKATLEKANEWYDVSMAGRGLPGYAEIIIQQRLHQCLPPDSLVRTPTGSVPICELRAGDDILTSEGTQQVVESASRRHVGSLVNIRTYGSSVWFRATGNHRILTERGWVPSEEVRIGDSLILKGPKPQQETLPPWPQHKGRLKVSRRSGSFTGSRGKMPPVETVQALVDRGLTVQAMATELGYKNRGSVHNLLFHYEIDRPASRVVGDEILNDSDFWWFVGLWLAEGCVTKDRKGHGHVRLTVHVKERPMLERVEKMLARNNLTISSYQKGNVLQASIFSKQLGLFLRQFGTNAKNKMVPEWVNHLPLAFIKEMFIGYWQGDGCLSTNKEGTHHIRAGSSSLDLLEGWQRTLLLFNVPSSIMRAAKAREMQIGDNKPYMAVDSWELRLYLSDAPWVSLSTVPVPPLKQMLSVRDGDLYLPVKTISLTGYEGDVWDIETPCHDFLTHSLTAHNSDFAAHALQFGEWEVLCLPEVYEDKHPFAWRGDPRTEGELLWPARRDWEEHAILTKKLGSKAAGQLQQRPSAREGQVIPRAGWRYYPREFQEAAEAKDVSKLPKFRSLICSWDTTFKDKNTSDYVAGGIWGVHGSNRYLLKTFHQQASLSATKTAMVEFRKWCLDRWPHLPVRTLIEKSANGVEIIDQLKQEVTGIVPVNASTDKITRAEACEPDFEGENVWVPGRASPANDDYDQSVTPGWVIDVIESCSVFPLGANDDLVDMVTMALNWVRTHQPATARTSSAYRGRARTTLPAAIANRRR